MDVPEASARNLMRAIYQVQIAKSPIISDKIISAPHDRD